MIQFGHNNIQPEDINRCVSVLQSGWLVNGPVVEELEREFCHFTGASYAIAMNSCTACLHTACYFLKEKQGISKLKVPDVTHVASAHAVRMAGLEVELVDVDPQDGIMLPEHLTGEEVIVHLAGQPAAETTPNTIEDCAHALGSKYSNGEHVGTQGLCGCFSFYPTKHITCAEGGMLITNNRELMEFARLFRGFGIDRPPQFRSKPGEYDSLFVSPNYRMSDASASLLIGQLKRFEDNRQHRIKIARIYEEELKGVVERPSWRNGTSWFIYQIQTENRDGLVEFLKKKEIQTSVHYRRPLSQMSAYNDKPTGTNSQRFADTVLSLPIHQGIMESDAREIIQAICLFKNS